MCKYMDPITLTFRIFGEDLKIDAFFTLTYSPYFNKSRNKQTTDIVTLRELFVPGYTVCSSPGVHPLKDPGPLPPTWCLTTPT
jgi:hypothetical protein